MPDSVIPISVSGTTIARVPGRSIRVNLPNVIHSMRVLREVPTFPVKDRDRVYYCCVRPSEVVRR